MLERLRERKHSSRVLGPNGLGEGSEVGMGEGWIFYLMTKVRYQLTFA
jgi:hypothetical protein